MLNSRIEYIDHSWNPWVGCHPVSEGCRNCYMYREQKRFGNDPSIVRRTAPATWRQVEKFRPGAVVFVCTWSDFWIEEADPWRDEAWRMIESRPDVRWLIVTKRPERASLPWGDKPWPNVVGIVTAENQAMADLRIPVLLRLNFAVRGVSIEPMLGPVDVWPWLMPVCKMCDGSASVPVDGGGTPCPRCINDQRVDPDRLDWVICGTESGPSRRPAKIEWIRALRDQCVGSATPFFLKQIEVSGKVAHAPTLDGRLWLEMPV